MKIAHDPLLTREIVLKSFQEIIDCMRVDGFSQIAMEMSKDESTHATEKVAKARNSSRSIFHSLFSSTDPIAMLLTRQ